MSRRPRRRLAALSVAVWGARELRRVSLDSAAFAAPHTWLRPAVQPSSEIAQAPWTPLPHILPPAAKASSGFLLSPLVVTAALALTRRFAASMRRAHAGAAAVKMRATGKESGAGAPVDDKEDEPFFEEVSGDDPLVLELEERLKQMSGNRDLTLDMVLNPGTIVNTEREVILLKAELKATPEEEIEKRKKLEDKIEEKQMKVVNEMRQVMTDSLKLEFLLQGLLSIPLFASFCFDLFPLPDGRWLNLTPLGVQLCLRLLGVWGIWLVTVPALRARKPGGPYGMGYEEKRALDVCFLILPIVCLVTPFFSKEPFVTFCLSLLALVACYLWSFNTPFVAENQATSRRGAGGDLSLPEPVLWAVRALDFGTGSERGEQSDDTSWQSQLDAYEKAAEELVAKRKQQEAAKAVEKEAAK